MKNPPKRSRKRSTLLQDWRNERHFFKRSAKRSRLFQSIAKTIDTFSNDPHFSWRYKLFQKIGKQIFNQQTKLKRSTNTDWSCVHSHVSKPKRNKLHKSKKYSHPHFGSVSRIMLLFSQWSSRESIRLYQELKWQMVLLECIFLSVHRFWNGEIEIVWKTVFPKKICCQKYSPSKVRGEKFFPIQNS